MLVILSNQYLKIFAISHSSTCSEPEQSFTQIRSNHNKIKNMSKYPKTNFINIGEKILPAVIKTLNKTEESLNENVKEVREWIKMQPHLPEIMDDKMIQNFLIMNKCNVEKTKTKIEGYYGIRSKLPCIFEKSNPKSELMKEVMDALYVVPLPNLTEDLYRVTIFKGINKDTLSRLHMYDVSAFGLNVTEMRLREDVMFGDIFVVDCKDIPFRYFLTGTPRAMHNILVKTYQGVYSTRLKALYVLNAPRIVEKMMGFLKFLINPKLFSRIHLCSVDNLKISIPEKILPRDYGGEEKSLKELQEMLKGKFLQYQNLFDKLDTMRIDEDLKPPEAKTSYGFGFF